MADETEAPAPFTDTQESQQVRRVIQDTYTAVRSAEINKTVTSFTLDHYIDEAKRTIKDSRIIRAASNPSKGIGTRPSKLQVLEKLEEDFNKAFGKAKEIAENTGNTEEGT